MQIRDRYDWIVLGDSIGALLSGAILSKLGMSVLFLPLYPSYLSRLSLSAQCIEPEPNFIPTLGSAGPGALLSNCLSRLGIPVPGLRFVLKGDQVMPQVLSPRIRLQVASQWKKFAENIAREIGPSTAVSLEQGIKSLFEMTDKTSDHWRIQDRVYRDRKIVRLRSPFDSRFSEKLKTEIIRMHQRRKVENFFLKGRQITDRRALHDLIEGIRFSVNGQCDDRLDLGDLVTSLQLMQSGAMFSGGVTAFRNFLINFGLKSGAHVPRSVQCKRVFVRQRTFDGIQVSNYGKALSARGAIVGSSIHHLGQYIYSNKDRKITLSNKGASPVGWRFTLSLTVHTEAIPPGMGRRAIWTERNAKPIEIEVASTEEYNLGSTDHRLVFLRTVLDYRRETLSLDYQRKIASRLFRQACEIFPFLEFHIVRMFPDFRESLIQGPSSLAKKKKDAEADGDDFFEAYGFQSLTDIPQNLLVYKGRGVGCYSGLRNLYVANSESHPDLGLFGSILAGIDAAQDFVSQNKGREFTRMIDMWSDKKKS